MIPYTTLSNGKITLRPFQVDDEPGLFAAIRESLEDLKPWMSWAHDNYSRAETRSYIATTRARWGEGTMFSFAITSTETGGLLGACSLSHIHPVYFFCNLGYWVRTSQRGRGYAMDAARLATRFAFEKVKLMRVEVVVAVGNESSLKVAEKIGAYREGVLRNRIIVRENLHDAVMFSFIPQDFRAEI